MSRRLLAGAWLVGMFGLAWSLHPNVDVSPPARPRAHEPEARKSRAARRPGPAQREPSATVQLEPHPLPGRAQLTRAAGGLDLARSVLASGDPSRVELLLGYLDARSAEGLLSPDDHSALQLASACLHDDSEQAREAAHAFLREVRGSQLRKDVRRACFR